MEPTSGAVLEKVLQWFPVERDFFKEALMSSELMRDECHLASEGFREENIEQKH